MLFLPPGEGEDGRERAGEHESQHTKHEENGEALSLTHEATLIWQTSGASEGQCCEDREHGWKDQTMMVFILRTR
jgi:hypothetical protein